MEEEKTQYVNHEGWRIGRVNQFGEELAREGKLEEAAVLWEAHAVATKIAPAFWSPRARARAAALYLRAGKPDQAADLYELAGRPAKASRLRGIVRYDVSEVEAVLKEISSFVEAKDRLAEALSGLLGPDPGKGATELIAKYERKLFKPGAEGWLLVLPRLFKLAVDPQEHRDTLRQIEGIFRGRGLWACGGALYLLDEAYDEFERVCMEEDELEVAALWYEQAGMAHRAAQIYELMAQGTGLTKDRQSASAHCQAQPQGEARSLESHGWRTAAAESCPACGTAVEPDWFICPKCEAELTEPVCPNPDCGRPLKRDWKRCPRCGTKVEG